MTPKRRPLGDKFRIAREERGWSRQQLAERLHISAGYVGHLERETPVPLSDALIDRICNELGLSIGSPVLRLLIDKHCQTAREYALARKRRAPAAP